MVTLSFEPGATYIIVRWGYDAGDGWPVNVTVNIIDPNYNVLQSQVTAGPWGPVLFSLLTPNTEYLFQWCGNYSEGGQDWTSCMAPQSATTTLAPPPPPPSPKTPGMPWNITAVDVSVGFNLKVHVSWEPGQGELPTASFEVERVRLSNGVIEQYYKNLPATQTTLDDTTGLAFPQKYIYNVHAFDSTKNSAAGNSSNVVEVAPPPAPPPFPPLAASRLAAASWGPNSLLFFGRGNDFRMYTKAWIGTWDPPGTDWLSLGGKFNFALPAVLASGPPPQPGPVNGDRIDVFGIGTDSAMYHVVWTYSGLWPSNWEFLGGQFTSAPAAVSWGPNRLDVFGVGADYSMYHKWWDGNAWGPSQNGWESLGGKFTSLPVVVSRGPNRLDVFGRGADLALYYKAWTGTHWAPSPTDWESLGGKFLSPPAVVPNAVDYLDVFGIGLDGVMYQKELLAIGWLPAKGEWESLGGKFKSWPSATSWGPNRIDIFGIGTDNTAYHKWYSSQGYGPSQTAWDSLGGQFTSAPAAVSWGPNRLDIFGIGMDASTYHKWWDGNAWGPSQNGWESLGGKFT